MSQRNESAGLTPLSANEGQPGKPARRATTAGPVSTPLGVLSRLTAVISAVQHLSREIEEHVRAEGGDLATALQCTSDIARAEAEALEALLTARRAA